MKKVFKKDNVVNTAVSVAMGGVANVGMDYIRANVDMLSQLDDKTYNLGKFGVGVLASTFVGNRYLKDALNGLAVVGISNYAQSLLDSTPEKTAGVSEGTIAKVPRLFARNLRSQYAKKVGGSASAFMG